MLNGYIPLPLARYGRAVLGTTVIPEWKGHFTLTGRTGQTELNWSFPFDFQPKFPEF